MQQRLGWKAAARPLRWRSDGWQPGSAALALDWPQLQARWQGQVLVRSEARPELGPSPAVCLRAHSESDVQHALEFLSRHEQGFAVRSGGQCLAGLSQHAEVVLDLGSLRKLAWDPQGLHAGPGLDMAELSAFLTSRGRSLATGQPHLHLGGLALQGGFGLLGRRDGLVCDQVLGLRMVSAQGRVLEVNAEKNDDLFWALRGAGAGQFGVVTELTLRSQPAQALNVLHAQWPLSAAAELLAPWQDWAPAADPRVNLELSLRAGPAQAGPEASGVMLTGVVLAEAHEAAALLEPWRRALGPLAERLCEWRLPAAAAAAYLSGRLDRRCEAISLKGPELGKPTAQRWRKSAFFERSLTPDAVQDALAQLCDKPRLNQTRELNFIPWGGAYAEGFASSPNAFNHRQARFLLRHTVTCTSIHPRSRRPAEAARAWLAAAHALLAPYSNGRCYQGDPDLELSDWAQAYYGPALPRLRAIKARHDPGMLLRHAQAIAPLAGPQD